MWDLNNEIKDVLILSNNLPQQFQEFVAFLQRLDNQIRTQEAEKKEKQIPWNTNTTPWAPPITNTPSTTTATHPGLMDLRANRRMWTPEEYQKRILGGQCLYTGGFGQLACVSTINVHIGATCLEKWPT
jgi:hypothetical protein